MSMADDDPGTASEALVNRVGKRRDVRDAALTRFPRLFADRREGHAPTPEIQNRHHMFVIIDMLPVPSRRFHHLFLKKNCC